MKHVSYKSAKLINDILTGILKEKRDLLKVLQADKKSPIEIYEKTLDKCKEIENAIKEMEKFL